MDALSLLMVCFVLGTRLVAGTPTGALPMACNNMKPLHPDPQNPPNILFNIDVTERVYKPGTIVSGTLYSSSGDTLKGFLIEARNNNTDEPLGEFVEVNATYSKTLCGDKNTAALTHVFNDNKTDIPFTWQAPDSAVGNISFRATVVRSYSPSRYWMDVFSSTQLLDCSSLPPGSDTDCDLLTSDAPPGTGTTETTPPGTTAPSVVTTTPPTGIPFDPDCGVKKGCFPDCRDSGCQYLVTWSNSGNRVFFQLAMQVSDSTTWVAIGFSETGKMDGTDVVACFPDDKRMKVETSHNMPDNQNVVYVNSTLGLSSMKGSYQDGVLRCEFSREKDMDMHFYHDLDRSYYLLVGSGPVSNGVKYQHPKIPDKSGEKVDFLRNYIVGEDRRPSLLIQVHASLMTAAWVLFSSVGVVTARHCKDMLGGATFLQLKTWFQIHRTCMTMAMLSVIAAFVAIFVEVGGLSQIAASEEKKYANYHPYLGIAVTALTVCNPVMALFRPKPTHKNRPIFNWAHFFVGGSAHILAVITMFFGLGLAKAKTSRVATYVMIAYVCVFVFVEFILEINSRRKRSDGCTGAKVTSYKQLHAQTALCESSSSTGDLPTPGGREPAGAEDVHGGKVEIVSYKPMHHDSVHFDNKDKTVGLASYTESAKQKDYGSLGLQRSTEGTKKVSGKLESVVLFLHVALMTVAAGLLVVVLCIPATFDRWLGYLEN